MKKLNKRVLISELKALAEKLGRTPIREEMILHICSKASVDRLFGGAGGVARAAGLTPNPKSHPVNTHNRPRNESRPCDVPDDEITAKLDAERMPWPDWYFGVDPF